MRAANPDVTLREAERTAQADGTEEAWLAYQRAAARAGDEEEQGRGSREAALVSANLEGWQRHEQLRVGLDLPAVEIPETDWHAPWGSTTGDVPGDQDLFLVRSSEDNVEVLRIQAVRHWIGDEEAAERGFPYWTQDYWYEVSDLELHDELQDMIERADVSPTDANEYAGWGPLERALLLAEIYSMAGGVRPDEGESGFSDDVLPEEDELSDEFKKEYKIGTDEDHWVAADEEFRVDVLGEEEEDEDGLYTYKEDLLGGIAIFAPGSRVSSIAYIQADDEVERFNEELKAIDDWWEEPGEHPPPYETYEDHLSDFLSRYDPDL